MAEADTDIDGLCKMLKRYAVVANTDKDENKFNKVACGRMVKDCFGQSCTTSGDIVFSKCLKKSAKETFIPLNNPDRVREFNKELFSDLSRDKKKGPKSEGDTAQKIICNGHPDAKGTKTSTSGGVNRMTDASKYTGSHKERFDESGKGKGKDGRTDAVVNTGYVGNYKEAGTYDKKH